MTERVVTGIVLFLFIGALPWSLFLFETTADLVAQDTRAMLRMFWFAAYIPTLFLVLRRWRDIGSWIFSIPFFLLLLVILAISSTMWSGVPEVTFRRSIALMLTTLFGLYLAKCYDNEEVLELLVWCLSFIMILNWIFALGVPSWGRMMYESGEAWRGVFIHKNVMGETMLLYLIVLTQFEYKTIRARAFVFFAGMLSLGLLLLSKSMTPVIIAVLLIVVHFLLNILRSDIRYARIFFVLSLLWVSFVGILILVNIDMILNFLGRDLSLTGRDEIWTLLLEQIQEHYMFGYGYNAFWGEDGGAATHVWNQLGWKMKSAHNGFLELCLSLGFLGLGLFMILYIKVIDASLFYAYTGNSWPLLFLIFFTLLNITESRILEQNNLYWVIFVVIAVQLNPRRRRIHSIQRQELPSVNSLSGDVLPDDCKGA